jgi:hypothetical protein
MRRVLYVKGSAKINLKGSGQECPPYTPCLSALEHQGHVAAALRPGAGDG